MNSMSTLNQPAVGVFTANAVARAVGLDVAALVKLGVRDCAELTRDDLSGLLAELRRRGFPTRVHSLEVFLKQATETPSRALIKPQAKNASPFRPAWMDRADLR